MITHEEALEIILKNGCLNEKETVSLLDCNTRILAEDIFSDMNMPPFNKSAVDGYACKNEDLPGPLRILEVISAGNMPQYDIATGTCSKIMTGAPVPKGADTVVMVEDTEEKDNTVVFKKDKTRSNICLAGEDITKGQNVLHKGTLIQPWHVGTMATVGVTKVQVFRKVKVGIITTGDEILEPEQPLVEGKIRNSSAYQLMSACSALPTIPTYYGIVKDKLEDTVQTLIQTINENDIVLLTGGVSMGDFDFVPQAILKTGMKILFDSVAMQPGRPLT